MNERIELSYDERLAADRAVLKILREENYGKDAPVFARILVGAALKAIDGVRAGDPVGTIRKGYQTGAVAVRIDVPNHSPWRVIFAGGDTGYVFADCVQSWPVIYRPDGAA